MAMTNGASDGAGPLGFGALGATTVKILIGGLVTFVLVIIVSLIAFWLAGCPKGGFQCLSGRCLPRSRWCNNKTDCEDGEDERKEECLPSEEPKSKPEDNLETIEPQVFGLCHLCLCERSEDGMDYCVRPPERNKKFSTCNISSDASYDRQTADNSHLLRHTTTHMIKNQYQAHSVSEGDGSYHTIKNITPASDGTFFINENLTVSQFSQISIPLTNTNAHRSQRSYRTEALFSSANTSITNSFKTETDGNKTILPQSTGNERNISFHYVATKAEGYLRADNTVTATQSNTDEAKATKLDFSSDKMDTSHLFSDLRVDFLQNSESSTGLPVINLIFLPYLLTKRPYQFPDDSGSHKQGVNCSDCPLSSNLPYQRNQNLKYPKSRRRKRHLYIQNEHIKANKSHKSGTVTQNNHETETDGEDAEDNEEAEEGTMVLEITNAREDAEGGNDPRDSLTAISDASKDTIARESRDHVFTEEPEEGRPHLTENYHKNTTSFDEISDLLSECYCEFKSQLKCLTPYIIKKVPDRIIGGITWMAISNNNITSLDPAVMSQYTDLSVLSIENNSLHSLQDRVFHSQESLQFLYLSGNRITNVGSQSFFGLSTITDIYLDRNNLTDIELSSFEHTPLLAKLDLSHNQLNFRENQTFPRLPHLVNLNLNNNEIRMINTLLLANLTSLHTLRLKNNKIEVVRHGAFDVLTQLHRLDLSGNRLHSVQGLFSKLESLHLLMLEELHFSHISEEQFANLKKLKVVYFSTFRYCRYVPHVPQCIPNHDGFSNVQDLVGWKALRVGVWVMASITLVGNGLVIFCRAISRKDKNNNILFIKNLAGADILMGVYLVMIGVQDVKMRGTFLANSLQWAESPTCTAAGILATVSSETSVFILTFMSLERYLCISNSYKDPHDLSERSARLCLLVIWLASISLALFPTLWISSFYGTNSMCFPLHINEPFLVGWQYSAFLFLGLNSISLILIAWSYTRLFMTRRHSIACTPLATGEVSFAVRFFFIVVTNCLCWLPIICVKAAALAYIDINGGVYTWLVVLVLPINSAVNPVLYTFSTSRFQKRLERLSKAVINFHRSRRRKSSDTDTLKNSSSPSFPTTVTVLQNQNSDEKLQDEAVNKAHQQATFQKSSHQKQHQEKPPEEALHQYNITEIESITETPKDKLLAEDIENVSKDSSRVPPLDNIMPQVDLHQDDISDAKHYEQYPLLNNNQKKALLISTSFKEAPQSSILTNGIPGEVSIICEKQNGSVALNISENEIKQEGTKSAKHLSPQSQTLLTNSSRRPLMIFQDGFG